MKNKLLLLFVIFTYFCSDSIAKNIPNKLNLELLQNKSNSDTIIKKQNKAASTAKSAAIIPPPLVTAGSTCKEISAPTAQVFITASGRSGDVIEWYGSQTSTTILHQGSIYAPIISKTTTYYVQTRAGSDNSVRIPVVASVYNSPPTVSLTVSPDNDVDKPLCFGTPLTFTATDGGDLFEFSVDGVVFQSMSTNREFVTNTLTNGQVVSVKTIYGVTFDGLITESTWGTGAMEDNTLSAPLSPNAVDGYINSVSISATLDKLNFGISGKLNNNRSLLLFLDTKPGGFNVSNYGDEPASLLSSVKAFNLFNNNPSTFDPDFFADYCLAITTDDGGTNYFADIIELKSGTSTKINLGNATQANPSTDFAVNTSNSGSTDYATGFEVAVLKSIINYTQGDISFFALTMQDDSDSNYNVTNSFSSPELTSTADYGNGAINYGTKDPNPVIVSENALTPCFKTTSKTVTITEQPTVATVGSSQLACGLTSASLEGNTPTAGTGKWTMKAGVGTVTFSDDTSGSSTATVSQEGLYTFTWTISNGDCVPSTADIDVDFTIPPTIPTADVIQPTCGTPSGTITFATQLDTEYSLDGNTYQPSNIFSSLPPSTYNLYVKNTTTNCVTPSALAITINDIPLPPDEPTATIVTQPTCGTPSGTITIAPQSGMEYSLDGINYQATNVFATVASNTYTLYVRSTTDITCVTASSLTTTIDAVPLPPVAPTAISVVQPTCETPLGTITITSQSGGEYSLDGTNYQVSNVFPNLVPANYTLYVRSTSDNTCISPSVTNTTINAVPPPPTVPTAATVIQPTCGTPSGTITIASQPGMEYSLDGTNYQVSNVFETLAPASYTLYVRNTSDNSCVTPSAAPTTINDIPLPPVEPTATSVTQPTCGTPSGTITIAPQSGMEYSLDGTNYQTSNVFATIATNTYTLYVRSITDNTCVTTSSVTTTIDAVPLPPVAPTAISVIQPTCETPSGTITITSQSGGEYSLDGTNYQASNVFTNLAPANYTLYVRSTSDNTCISPSATNTTINAVPPPPTVPTANVIQPTCGTPSGTITIASQSGMEYSLDGTNYQASNIFENLAPSIYTLYVRNTSDNTCITPSAAPTTINDIPLPPVEPTATSVVQPTCGTPSGTITIAPQSGMEYSVNGTTYNSSNVFSNLAPADYTLYVRSTTDNTCVTSSSLTTKIDAVPLPPVVPTASSVIQASCGTPTGTITITAQSGVQYSINGTSYQSSNVFSNLAPASYTLYVRNIADITCITQSASTTTINPIQVIVTPTATVIQPTCAIPTGTITIVSQTGVEYSLNGSSYQSSNIFENLAPANNYTLYLRNTTDNTCVASSVASTTINAVPLPPIVPTTTSVTQPTCSLPSGTITVATQSGVEYSLDGTTFQTSNIFSTLSPNTYTIYVRNSTDNTCQIQSNTTVVIDPLPALPMIPTVLSSYQPTCSIPSGGITFASQSNVEYSLGGAYQDNPVFTNLSPGNYTLSVRFKDSPACITIGSEQTINPVPTDIQFESTGDCVDKSYVLTATPLNSSYDPDTVEYEWKDNSGSTIGSNSNTLNISSVLSSIEGKITYPLNISLTVTNSSIGCETTKNITIETAFCNIQKGISPDGNGSNDTFDLRLMDVKKLEIFDRYGVKVYDKINYTDQWKGQSNNGNELPGATYYYVIEFNNSTKAKTGWIYLIREK